MKSHFILLFTFASQISAYYDDVQNAVFSEQDSFGKLLTDVETDVKASIDCTLLTVGHVLDYDKSLSYRSLCKEEPPPDNAYYTQPQVDYYAFPADAIFSNEIIQRKQLTDDELDRNINVVKSDINETIFEFLNRHSNIGGRYEEESVSESESITNETDQFKQNIDSISENIHKELREIEFVPNNETIAVLLKEVQLLHNEENSETNATNNIHQIILDTLQELSKTHTSTNSTNSGKFKEVIVPIEKESNNTYEDNERHFIEWRNLESKLDEIKDLLENQQNFSQKTTNVKSRNFQDIAIQIGTESSLDQQDENKLDVTVTTQIPKESTNDYTTNTSTIRTTPIPSVISTASLKISSVANTAISSSHYASLTTGHIMASTINTKTFQASTEMPLNVTKPQNKITTGMFLSSTNAPPLLTTKNFSINTESTTKELNDYDALFNSNDEDGNKDAVKSATNVIEESKKSQSIFDTLFKSSSPFMSPKQL